MISLHYGTLKVFQSHAKSSQADFFNCKLPAALTAISSTNCLVMLGILLYSHDIQTRVAENGLLLRQKGYHLIATIVLRNRACVV
jgi:hypothetical protein